MDPRGQRGRILSNGIRRAGNLRRAANLPTAGWPGLCIDKEEAANLVLRFIRETSAHVAGHSALLAIDVWNEPHLEPMFDYRGDMLCYCGHSAERFREWLQKKYGTVDALNAAWFRRYRDWCEALPPPRLGTGVDMMDWRLFWLENMRRWMRMRVTAAREGAPETWIQSHVAYSGYVGASGRGGLANELGDEFLLSREVDVFGLTCFPKWLMRDDPLFNHMINNEIVAAASREKPFYQVELQGGGGKAGYLGGEVPTGRRRAPVELSDRRGRRQGRHLLAVRAGTRRDGIARLWADRLSG